MDAANRAIFRHELESWMDALMILKLEASAYFKQADKYKTAFEKAYNLVYGSEFAHIRLLRRQGKRLSPGQEKAYSDSFQKAHAALVELHQETTRQMKESKMELPLEKGGGPGSHFFGGDE